MNRTLRLNAKLADRAEHKALLLAREDLRLAANKTITRLYCGEKREDEPEQTAAYRIVGGIKGHEPAYVPTTRQPLSSGARLAVATLVYQRLRTDRRDIAAGRKSLATFRRMAIVLGRRELRILGHEQVEVMVWGKPNPRWVRFDVWPAGRHARSTWRAVVAGTLKHGDLKLQLDRLGRWFMLLSHDVLTEPERETGGTLLVQLAATGDGLEVAESGKPDRIQRLPLPCNFWRLWQRELELRRAIWRTGAEVYGQREGRGRSVKLRPLETRREKYLRRVEDACRVLARAVANWAERGGCRVVVLEDLRGEVVEEQDATEDTRPRDSRAEERSKFLRRQRGRIHQLVVNACGPKGIQVQSVYLGKDDLIEGESRLVALAQKAAAQA